MKLYLLGQDDNLNYDTHDSCIVCAEDESDARTITPNDEVFAENDEIDTSWAFKASAITCTEIGHANDEQKRGVILASFNAG